MRPAQARLCCRGSASTSSRSLRRRPQPAPWAAVALRRSATQQTSSGLGLLRSAVTLLSVCMSPAEVRQGGWCPRSSDAGLLRACRVGPQQGGAGSQGPLQLLRRGCRQARRAQALLVGRQQGRRIASLAPCRTPKSRVLLGLPAGPAAPDQAPAARAQRLLRMTQLHRRSMRHGPAMAGVRMHQGGHSLGLCQMWHMTQRGMLPRCS